VTSLFNGRQIPLVPSGPHGSRSNMTCRYRCGNACARPEPNQSGNESMRDLVERSIARRTVLKSSAVGAGAVVIGHGLSASSAAAAQDPIPRMAPIGGISFKPVAPNNRDSVTVPQGFGHHVVISWGDRVVPGAPRFDVESSRPGRLRCSSDTTATTSVCCR
jgi:hypothetical protein